MTFETEYQIAAGPFAPTWESLKQYRCPEWFRDAKFGIWAHWGPQAVPMEGDWYARNLYVEGCRQYQDHLERYGHPSVHGFKDILPLWKAEKFDPERLMDLYVRAGAKYFVALGVHCDNFDCWNSRHHRWNAVNMGPHRDIVGAWRDAARARGLRFGVTEHVVRSYNWFNTNKGSDKEGPFAGVPYDGNDPQYQDFYFPPHDDTSPGYPLNPPEWWKKQWFDRVKDLTDSYKADLLYIDGGVPFGDVGRRLMAHLYNASTERRGGQEMVCLIKDLVKHKWFHGEYEEGVGTLDIERGVVKEISPEPWQTCTCVGEWYYKKGMKYKSPTLVIHMLADIVSKNGNMLLNFPPRPDGTLDEEEESIVAEIIAWMDVNAEAIHGTRPWKQFGEGPTMAAGGYFSEEFNYTPQDVRFTAKGNTLYAILLGWPGDGAEVTIQSVSQEAGSVRGVELLGNKGQLPWKLGAEGLVVQLPHRKPCDHAVTLKFTR